MSKINPHQKLRTTLDYFHITKLLGEGSYAKVYLAHSVLCELPVALKCFDKNKLNDDKNYERLNQEITILTSLDSQYIIKLYEIFENDKWIFLVLEYIDDLDLLNWLKNNGKFSEETFFPIFIQICRGLYYLQKKHILHWDIKLDNILINKNNEIKICDFGISRLLFPDVITYEHIGTPAYLAPEIIKESGYKNYQSDIWSLGIMSFIAMTGMVPFKGNDIETLNHNILNDSIDFENAWIKLSSWMKQVL